MAEIITVQLGSYANVVGSHFWNIQDEVISCSEVPDWSTLVPTLSSEVVCAWNEDRFGDASYAPRVVVVDLSGSLGGVSFSRSTASDAGAAAGAAAQHGGWAGGMQVQQAPSIAKSRYRQQLEDVGELDTDPDDPDQLEAQQQALEAAAAELHAAQRTPRYWTDYLQVDLPSSCVLTLSGAWQGQAGWDGWGVSGSSGGSAVREVVEEAVDKVRWWAEQCDRLQGLQLLADDLGGWGGICLDVLQQLREQYPSQPMLYFSLQQQQQQAAAEAAANRQTTAAGLHSPAHIRRLLSSSLSLSEVPQLASLYVPLDAGVHSASGLTASRFQSAALLAAAIDTVTLPLRCTGARSALGPAEGATDMHSLINLLSGPAANLAAAAVQLPAAPLPSSSSSSGGAGAGMQPTQQQQQQLGALDPRQPSAGAGNSGSGGSSGSSGSGVLSLEGASWSLLTPGVALTPDHCMAESVTLRGARPLSPTAPLSSVAVARAALDSLLLQRQRAAAAACHCIAHSCISPLPFPAPLSFPLRLLPKPAAATAAAAGPGTRLQPPLQGGSASAAAAAAAAVNPYLPRSTKAPSIPAPGVLSRLTASSGFGGLLQGSAGQLQRASGFAAGRSALEEWGYGVGDVEELREGLLAAAGRYELDFD